MAEQQRDASTSLALQALVQAIPGPVFVVGLDDRILASNRAADRLLDSNDAIAGRPTFKDLSLAYRASGLRAAIEHVKGGGDGVRLEEQRVTASDGERMVVFDVAPVRLGDRLLGVVASAEDRSEVQGLRVQLELVTEDLQDSAQQMEVANEELRVANEALLASNAQLEAQIEELCSAQEAIRHKDEFLAMLAHELRNPLAPILTAAHVLHVQSHDPAAVQRSREIIERQVRHQARLLDDLLDVSRITRGTIDLQRRPVDLVDVVAQAVETAGALIADRHHDLSIAHWPEPLAIDADPVRLAQVVGNLLVNAAKFTPPGGRIGVRTERDGEMAALRVSDSGIGIPPEMLDRVFVLFTQVDPSLARSQGGLGIGLTLVKRLVEMHGGTVAAVSSGPGHGSEFIVRLPLGVAAAMPVAAAASRPWRRRRVLVVEDHDDARDMMREALRLEGHEVFVAEDGARGVEMALLHRPEVALVDLGLPGVSGYEVAAHIRTALGTRVTLVALTGYGQPEDRLRSRTAGFDAHLVKPVGVAELDAVLRATNGPSA